MVVVFSLVMLWKNRKDKASGDFTWEALIPVAALLGLVFCSYLVGMLLSMTGYIFLWLKFIEKHKTTSSLTISLGCVLVIYGIFVAWLHVPMPKGLLGFF